VLKGRHVDHSMILLCVRWYLAYGPGLRNLEEMMAECGISVDHATIHRWTVHCPQQLLEQFNLRKRAILVGTNRMVGRWTASAIASASRRTYDEAGTRTASSSASESL